MSSHLWKYYLEDDVERFRHLLETAGYNVRNHAQKGGGGGRESNMIGGMAGSPTPAPPGTSPTMTNKSRKGSNWALHAATQITRADINWKDVNGLTLLHRAASATTDNAISFAHALIEHPLTDLYLQDAENGWTALHRAFYFGNIAIARAIMERDTADALGQGRNGVVQHAGGLIKVKDREGHGPLDLYAATIKDRTLRPEEDTRVRRGSNAGSEDEHLIEEGDENGEEKRSSTNIEGDEVYTFGSNKNITLGFGDEDDRQNPERITLRRPDHLLQRFHREYLDQHDRKWAPYDSITADMGIASLSRNLPVQSLPWKIKSRPLVIQDVFMSKLHTAVITTDPESNLYICGHGPGGRLGLGHERTQFNFSCVEGGALAGKKISTVALGLNHTLAISEEGEVFSWGSNGFGQLGYSLPKTGLKDDEPINTVPRQIFGSLKRDIVLGVAASRIHSVVHTSTSLYTFGKNEGQLGIVDSDARSLEIQVAPRKVAASLFASPIASVAAIDKATICLLENHDVWVFANYGYTRVQFPLDSMTSSFIKQSFLITRYDTTVNHVCKVTAGGDTICAMSSSGEVYTLAVSLNRSDAQPSGASTTNPTKIRGALSAPQRIWDLKKNSMAARDVGVDADGSIIITTEEGSVWKRSRRTKIKDAKVSAEYKFSRISGLTRVLAVRASAHGAYAAVRRDCDVTKNQVLVAEQTLWDDLFPLLCFHDLQVDEEEEDSETEQPQPRFWQARQKLNELQSLCKQLLQSDDVQADVEEHLRGAAMGDFADYDALVGSTASDTLRIPVHQFILAGRSRILQRGLESFNKGGHFDIPELLSCENSKGRPMLKLNVDILTLINFVLYLYTDTVVEYWQHTRRSPEMAFRYRLVRTELMKLAAKLDLHKLEPAVRQMIQPDRCLSMDMEVAIKSTGYFSNGDIKVQLADDELLLHGALVCQRCPFFEGLFMGRAAGRWLEGRRSASQDASDPIEVDLRHIESSIFRIVLRHIYADTGEELFDDIVSADVDEFLDLVMEVMSVANELMLDRLSQICQRIIGRFVTTRNVCGLLNAIAPSAVTEFKDASLEYMCLSLEAMLQGGLLDELDEDLLLELDAVVRDNQLACLPIAKSGRAEADLLERNPRLAVMIDRERRAKVDSIMLHSKYQDVEAWGPHSFKGHSFDEASPSPAQHKARRRSSREAGGLSPALRGKAAVQGLGASIEEDAALNLGQPALRNISSSIDMAVRSSSAIGTPTGGSLEYIGKQAGPMVGTPVDDSPMLRNPWPATPATPASSSKSVPWVTPSPGTKLEMKDIMAQASSSRVSNLSLGIAASRAQEASAKTSPLTTPAPAAALKMSQKERKKMLQIQQEQIARAEALVASKSASPWQTVQKGQALKDIINSASSSAQPSPGTSPKPSSAKSSMPRTSTTPQLTMRQTIANPKPGPTAAKNIGPSTPPVVATRSVSGPVSTKATPPTPSHAASPLPLHQASSTPSSSRKASKQQAQQAQQTAASVIAPPPVTAPPDLSSQSFPNLVQSIRHQPAPVEPSLQLSMSEILSQQQLEKDILREAREAKRSLQDIQAEQEFQEWWDRESLRMKEDEEMARLIAEGKDPVAGGSGGKGARGGRRGGKGKDGAGRGGKGGQGGSGGGSGGSKGAPGAGAGKSRAGAAPVAAVRGKDAAAS